MKKASNSLRKQKKMEKKKYEKIIKINRHRINKKRISVKKKRERSKEGRTDGWMKKYGEDFENMAGREKKDDITTSIKK